MNDHARWTDTAGAYVLGAMASAERDEFEAHLATCAVCQEEVHELRPAADALPMASPTLLPPPELKDRIMAEVEREAALLGAAGAGADRPEPRVRRPRRGPGWLGGWRLAPAAAALLAVGVLAGFAIAGLGGGTETYPGTIDNARLQGASAELRVEGDEATLVADGLPEPDGSFQVWLMPEGSDTPEPSVLFLPRDGAATAAVPGVEDARAVLVTREPKSGSSEPSEQPVIEIPLT
jgi:anti-sigma-K factor RskA